MRPPPKGPELDDFLRFRPRLGGGRRPRPREDSFRSAVYRAARLTTATARAVRRSTRRTRVDVRAPHPLARRVIVKAHIARMTASGARVATLHLRYIERDGVERDGTPGVLYGPEGPLTVDTFNTPRPREKHQFRLIVSPEDGHELDLTDYVRRLMNQLERDLGQRIEWAAVNHHDTGHPHAHVVVRGVDRDGHEVRLDRQYISHGLRWRAQEIATEELGLRHPHEIQRTHGKQVTQERYTALDREIARRESSRQVTLRTRAGPASPLAIREGLLLARLAHLEHLDLARRVAPSAWTLAPGWAEHLKVLGEHGDILAAMHRDLRSDPAQYRIVLPGQRLEPTPAERGRVLRGRVVRKGLADELRASFYVVVETPGGAGYRLPLDARCAEELRQGDVVSFATRPQRSVRPEDHGLEQAAQHSRGLVVLAPAPSAGHDRLRQRLRELTKLGLTAPDGADRWRVPTDLVAQLEARDARAPRYRVDLRRDPLHLDEQIGYRGPVWLDTLRDRPLAPYGFGADVQQALDRRVAFLRTLGIDPVDPRRLGQLREIERRTLGPEIAARTGQKFLLQPPESFRGRVEIAENRSMTPLAIVSDGSRFLLVPLTRELRAARGQSVTLGRDLPLQKGQDLDLER